MKRLALAAKSALNRPTGRARLDEGERDQPLAGEEDQLKPPPVPKPGSLLREPDFDVGKIERRPVEGMDRLVDGLLGDKDEPLRGAVAPRPAALRLIEDKVDDVLRQGLGGLDVDADADEPPAPRGDGERVGFVMGERANDPGRPKRRSGGRARQRRGRIGPELVEQRTGGDARRPARPADLDPRPGPSAGEGGFVARPDAPRRYERAIGGEFGLQRRRGPARPPGAQRAASPPWTSLAGLPRQREPAGVISPFIRKASASRWVLSFIVTP